MEKDKDKIDAPKSITKQSIGYISLLVNDYDKAIAFYTEKLLFDLLEDITLSDKKRWVIIAPRDSTGCCLVLAKASSPVQKKYVGNQTGGRVFLFLHTDNFWSDYNEMRRKGIKFLEEEPREESYGTVIVFEDLYGNKWDLLELKA